MKFRRSCVFLLAAIPFVSQAQTTYPVVVQTNTTIRIMASNLTSGNNQSYLSPGLNIMKALKPDVVAIQEFKYGSSSSVSELRQMIDSTFGVEFQYVGETGKSIPNGVISRYPILQSGVWDDPQVSDREFIWARIDIPGTNDLYVVSVHLHSGGGASSRSIEATAIKNYVQSNFPANAFVAVAGDFNTDTRSEAAITTFKTFLSDTHQPADQNGNKNTNANRNKPYDYVLPSFSLNSNHVATVIGSSTYASGLVFDSRVYTPLSEVPPVVYGDSAASNMQHMGVVKDFRINYTVTNHVPVTSPQVSISGNTLRWNGQSNVPYTVYASTNLLTWTSAGTISSTSNVVTFPLTNPPAHRSFYRVRYP